MDIKLAKKGRTVIISGDTNYSENLVNKQKGRFINSEIPDAPKILKKCKSKRSNGLSHDTKEMAKIINIAEPKLTVLLTFLL
ncbi:MAG: hypothetical protein Ct9H90mP18_03560 [Gammaproteobacteria bacterium]|nr:MAG: hypothetical protein Ct9H90mP18_03560 [Gammaproteobacteria bacterium]